MSIEHLPYIKDTIKKLFEIYKKNEDTVGLSLIVIVCQSALLTHIIEQFDYILDNAIVEDNLNYLRDVRDNYKKLLDSI